MPLLPQYPRRNQVTPTHRHKVIIGPLLRTVKPSVAGEGEVVSAWVPPVARSRPRTRPYVSDETRQESLEPLRGAAFNFPNFRLWCIQNLARKG